MWDREQEALPVLGKLEPREGRRRHLRRPRPVDGRAEQRATARPSRAARLVEESRSVGTQLVALDAVLDLARRRLRGEVRRPQLDAEVPLLGMLHDVEDAVARD